MGGPVARWSSAVTSGPSSTPRSPDLAEREARALQVAEGMAVPTPELLAVDPTGADAGVPAVVMSCLPGRVDWQPADLDRWLGRLAELLPPIHAAHLPPPGTLPLYAPYGQDSYAPPAWSSRPRVWERAVEVALGAPPEDKTVVVHRDFHPGNVLWRRGRVTGLVDWQAASIGPGSVDVGHCRVNLLRFGLTPPRPSPVAGSVSPGLTYEPWADVVAVVGFLDGLRDDPGSDAHLVEALLARALGDLGGP